MANPSGKNQYTGRRSAPSALLSHKPDVKHTGSRSVALRHQIAQRELEREVAAMRARK